MVYVGFLEIKLGEKPEDVIKKWTAAVKAWKRSYPYFGTCRLYGKVMGIGPKPMYLAILEMPEGATLDEYTKSYFADTEVRKIEDDWREMIDGFQASIMDLLSEVK